MTFKQNSSKGAKSYSHNQRPKTKLYKENKKKPAESSRHENERQLSDPRRVAFDVIVAVSSREAYANLLLPSLLRNRALNPRDSALATELCYGTLRAQGTLNAIIEACSSRPLEQISVRVLAALQLGAYQLLRMRTAEHAAISTTVDLVKQTTEGASGFANAILRAIQVNNYEQWLDILAEQPQYQDPNSRLGLVHSHPGWIVRAFADALGPAKAELAEALAADDAPEKVHIVTRPSLLSRDDLVAEDSKVSPAQFSRVGGYLQSGSPSEVKAIKSGTAAVQDEGSQLVVLGLLDSEIAQHEDASERWLDLCAGPGGKTGLMGSLAELVNAEVTAVEISEHRAQLVRTATEGLPVDVTCADGRHVGEQTDLPAESFHRVLVDAPCSGLGALRRRPEARWRRQPGDISELTQLQRELLMSGIRAAKAGGLIAYVTCSPHIAETSLVVADVLKQCQKQGIAIEQLDAARSLSYVPNIQRGKAIQLWPHRHGTDAMFMALLRKA